MLKRIFLSLATLAFLALGYGVYKVSKIAYTGAGYYAKVMCSGVFVSGRTPESVLSADLAINNPIAKRIEVSVDRDQQLAITSVAGVITREALYRPGLGCTVLSDVRLEQLQAQALPDLSSTAPPAETTPWPIGDLVADTTAPEGMDPQKLTEALDRAFSEPVLERLRRTRAVVVVHNGQVVAERYADGFSASTPLAGWSMTKSVTNALVGILVKQGRLSLDDPAPVAEWADVDDPRRTITLDHLMRMSSGLAFEENYVDYTSDAPYMLFNSPDAGGYAANQPLAYPPDSVWAYSSGTTNIISRIVRKTVGGTLGDYWTFARRALFDPLDMRSATIEPDPSGTFVGSSFMYATARDWARFGLLYLQDGIWEGERLLPEGWVTYSTTPTPKASMGEYGAQVWLNAGEPENPSHRSWPNVPSDAYFFNGYEGQSVVVIPSKNLVVVRLGLSQDPTSWQLGPFLEDILKAVSGPRSRIQEIASPVDPGSSPG